ncbi:gp126 [Sphingomonas phage PAU]|uniref:gp126 n=1 Tax=Sphingomonas phage PAU TaxID=1150991 RepID=UPI0002573271|nr:gp126 [Sphingomonas phage PAU]AFF28124.1 gp126 [Sphingomonas phage PAU]
MIKHIINIIFGYPKPPNVDISKLFEPRRNFFEIHKIEQSITSDFEIDKLTDSKEVLIKRLSENIARELVNRNLINLNTEIDSNGSKPVHKITAHLEVIKSL